MARKLGLLARAKQEPDMTGGGGKVPWQNLLKSANPEAAEELDELTKAYVAGEFRHKFPALRYYWNFLQKEKAIPKSVSLGQLRRYVSGFTED